MSLSNSIGASQTVRLPKLSTVPGTADLDFVLTEAKKSGGKPVELPFEHHGNMYTIKLTTGQGRTATTWSLLEEATHKVLWNQPQNDVLKLQNKIKMEVISKHPDGSANNIVDNISNDSDTYGTGRRRAPPKEKPAERQPIVLGGPTTSSPYPPSRSTQESAPALPEFAAAAPYQREGAEAPPTLAAFFPQGYPAQLESFLSTPAPAPTPPPVQSPRTQTNEVREAPTRPSPSTVPHPDKPRKTEPMPAKPELNSKPDAPSKQEVSSRADSGSKPDTAPKPPTSQSPASVSFKSDLPFQVDAPPMPPRSDAPARGETPRTQAPAAAAPASENVVQDLIAEPPAPERPKLPLPPPIVFDKKSLNQVHTMLVDPVSGLMSYPTFVFFLFREFVRYQKDESPLSAVIFELALFTRGRVFPFPQSSISQVAQRMWKVCSPIDVACHLSSGEFGVLLPSTNASGAVDFSASLYDALTETPLFQEQDVSLIVAVGCASLPDTCKHPEVLVAAARQAKELAKKANDPFVLFPA